MLKIEKNKAYTYDEIKKIFEEAVHETIKNPTGGMQKEVLKDKKEEEIFKFEISMSLSGIVILHTLKENLFEENKDKEVE